MLLPQLWYLTDSLKTVSQKSAAADKILPYNSVTGESEVDWSVFSEKIARITGEFDYIMGIKIFLLIFLLVSLNYVLSFFIFYRLPRKRVTVFLCVVISAITVYSALLFLFEFRYYFILFLFAVIASVISVIFYTATLPEDFYLQAGYLRFFPYRLKNVVFMVFSAIIPLLFLIASGLFIFFMTNFMAIMK